MDFGFSSMSQGALELMRNGVFLKASISHPHYQCITHSEMDMTNVI